MSSANHVSSHGTSIRELARAKRSGRGVHGSDWRSPEIRGEMGTLERDLVDLESEDRALTEGLSESNIVERSLRHAATIALASEREARRRLASDLHDDVGQLLSLASIRARSLAVRANGAQASEFRELSALLATKHSSDRLQWRSR